MGKAESNRHCSFQFWCVHAVGSNIELLPKQGYQDLNLDERFWRPSFCQLNYIPRKERHKDDAAYKEYQ